MSRILKSLSLVGLSFILAACGSDAPPTVDAVVDSTPAVAAKGTISGTLDLTPAAASILNNATLRLTVSLAAVNGQGNGGDSGFWVIPNPVNAVAGANDKLKAQASNGPKTSHAALPPMINPTPIVVDSGGNFSVDVPAGADYTLLYVDPTTGEGVNEGNIHVGPNKNVNKNIKDSDKKPKGNFIFSTVDSLTGAELQDVKATLLSFSQTTLTAADGSASFEGLPVGQYSLLFEKEGYASRQEDVVVVAFSLSNLLPTDMGAVSLIPSPGALGGQIESSFLDNSSNVIVYLRDANGGVHTTLTSASGIFEFNNLPPSDSYSVIVTANDHKAMKVDNVAVVSNRKTSVPTLQLEYQELASISGHARFFDRIGEMDHAGIIVSIEGTDQEAITSRDGAYVINGIDPGIYTVNFTDANHVTETQEIEVFKSTAASIKPIVLGSLKGSLTGLVKDASGVPVGNAVVALNGSGLDVLTDVDGVFNFANAPVGAYTLSVSKLGHISASRAVQIKTDTVADLSAAPFTLTASLSPSVVPLAIASKKLEPIFSVETCTFVLIGSVCGYNILEIIMAPGAAMTDAANK